MALETFFTELKEIDYDVECLTKLRQELEEVLCASLSLGYEFTAMLGWTSKPSIAVNSILYGHKFSDPHIYRVGASPFSSSKICAIFLTAAVCKQLLLLSLSRSRCHRRKVLAFANGQVLSSPDSSFKRGSSGASDGSGGEG